MKDLLPRRLKFAIRAAVTVGLLGLALSLVDLKKLGEIAVEVEWAWLVLAFLLVVVIIVFESLQFAAVARAFGDRIETPMSIKMTLVGRFFSLFTPAMLGSDIYRAIAMYGRGMGARSSIRLAAISRIMSLLSLVPVLVAGLPLIAVYSESMIRFLGYAAVIGGVLAVTLLILFVPAGTISAGSLKRLPYLEELAMCVSDLRFVAFNSPSTRDVWMSATLQHFIRVIAIMMVGWAFRVDAGFGVFFAFAPVSLLVAMVPISIGSWGLRELALIYSLGLVGVSSGSALLISVTFGLLGIPLALMGGILWAITPGASGPRSGPGKS